MFTQVITYSPHTLCELPNLSMVGDVGLFTVCLYYNLKWICWTFYPSVTQKSYHFFFSWKTEAHSQLFQVRTKKYKILFWYGYQLEGYCPSPSIKIFFCWCSNTLVPAITAHIFFLNKVFLFSPSLLVLKSHFKLRSLLVCLAPLPSFLWAI